MTDCSNVEIREQLPDLVSGTLSRVEVEQVETHVRDCAECAHELMILRDVFALRPATRAVDVAAIVAALPQPARIAQRPSQWQRWRIAAALATVAIGGLSWQVARQGSIGFERDTPLSDSVSQVATMFDSATRLDSGALLAANEPTRQVAVSFGGLGDYSDEELQQILDRLDKWDGAPSTEPLPSSSMPLIPQSDGGRR